MLSRFHLIPERYGRTDGRTDGQTDGQICYINIARQYANARQKCSILLLVFLLSQLLKVVKDHSKLHRSESV